MAAWNPSKRAVLWGLGSIGNAVYLNNLALLLRTTNRLGEAKPLMRRALGIDDASHGSDHSNVAGHLNNLAQLLRSTDRFGEAEPLMARAFSPRCELGRALWARASTVLASP